MKKEDLLRTKGIDQISLEEAIERQYRIAHVLFRHMTATQSLEAGDYGQAAHPDGRPAGSGGGRPLRTILVENVIAELFGAEAALLVPGAGTGAIRTAAAAVLAPGGTLLVHDAPVYKTTEATIKMFEYRTIKMDFNHLDGKMAPKAPDAILIQHIPQKPGDHCRIEKTISFFRKCYGEGIPIITDDNYAVMRARKIGTETGADLSAFSTFKLLGPEGVGCIVGKKRYIEAASKALSSAGCQVQGPAAMEVIRGMIYAPVALAIQKKAITETAERINEKRQDSPAWGKYIEGAFPLEAGHPNIVMILKEPKAGEFLRLCREAGAAGYSVGEESRYDVLPVFTHISSNFIKADPDLDSRCFRINPFRCGPDTVMEILDRVIMGLESKKERKEE